MASASGATAPAAGLGGIGGGVRLHGNVHPTEPDAAAAAVSQLFERSAAALAAGRSPEIVWCQAVSCLPVSETDKRALSELVNALQGDEASACKGILLARKELQNSLSQLEKQRPDEEKRAAALCFSAAALLVILLI